ncbi:MAG: hypothetical protein V3R88_06690 [Alphaproteobacteria bacterium]
MLAQESIEPVGSPAQLGVDGAAAMLARHLLGTGKQGRGHRVGDEQAADDETFEHESAARSTPRQAPEIEAPAPKSGAMRRRHAQFFECALDRISSVAYIAAVGLALFGDECQPVTGVAIAPCFRQRRFDQ